MNISHNLESIRKRIDDICLQSGLPVDQVQLLAVSKTRPVSEIEQAFQAGQKAFGENYLQEALEKITTLADLPLEWHYIGRIQSNKTRPIAEHFDWVHTISDIKHARRLSEQRPAHLADLNVCIQVNISEDPNKAGVVADQTIEIGKAIQVMPRLKLRGLMTIPEATEDPNKTRAFFKKLSALRDTMNNDGFSLDTLSMGMSGDMNIAIEEGSSIVRIGTAIFGPRAPVT